MNGLQIFILIAGAILFTVSFFVPEKQTGSKEFSEKADKAVKDAVDQQLSNIQDRVDDAAGETVEHVKDSVERQMERLTNEKMMAVNEYSDTVLNEIHKNHEEAVFLYDMLNNKHEQIKGTIAELNQTIRSAKQNPSVKKAEEKTVEKTERKEAPAPEKKAVRKEVSVPKMPDKKAEKDSRKKQPADQNVEVMLGNTDTEANSNDEILKLHKAGKSNMAIARKLGLGIGEVKLVIDLFEGGM